MAKILTTAIVADIRNKLNGSVFSKNRYGSYVRTKVTPVNPQTAAQIRARNILGTLSQNWRSLTDSQRQSWIDAAPSFPVNDVFGNQKFLSGNALYVQLNTNLINAMQPIIDVAPSPGNMPPFQLTGLEVDVTTGAMELQSNSSSVPAGFSLLVMATPSLSPSINFVKNRFRMVNVSAASTAVPIDVYDDYSERFSVPIVGMTIHVKAFLINNATGQAGVPSQASTNVLL